MRLNNEPLICHQRKHYIGFPLRFNLLVLLFLGKPMTAELLVLAHRDKRNEGLKLL